MAGNRIRVAKDKAALVKDLTASDGKTGPFQTYADVMVFAAALGVKRKKRPPLKVISKREPGPIGLEIFVSRGYEVVIKLIAIAEIKDTKILSSIDKESEEKRIYIFEEYANGGLDILRNELRGAVDYSERLLLILNNDRYKKKESIANEQQEFDLSRFL